MDLGELILSDSQRSECKEIIARMRRNEQGLYSRTIGPLRIIKHPGIHAVSLELFKTKLKAGKYVLVKKLGHGISIFKEQRK